MVLGLRTKSKRGTSIQVIYVVQVQDIKHWHSLFFQKPQHSILLNWENGSDNSGSILSTLQDGKMSFTESFKLSVTLWQEAPKKDQKHNIFRKNCLELSLYELRMDMATKSHLLGTVLINLAEYGIINECTTIYAPVNCKKNSKNTSQPVIFLKIYPDSSESSNSHADNLVSKVAALKDGEELASASINETTEEEVEFSSLTEDDISLHSSHSISSSAFEVTEDSIICSEEENIVNIIHEEAVVDKSCGKASSSNGDEISEPLTNPCTRNEASADSGISKTESCQGIAEESGTSNDVGQNKWASEKNKSKEYLASENSPSSQTEELKGSIGESLIVTELNVSLPIEMGETRMYDMGHHISENISEKKMSIHTSSLVSNECKPEHAVSKEDEDPDGLVNINSISDVIKVVPISDKEKHATDNRLDGRNELISRIEMLEEELCEVAAIEAGFYSVVVEHGSSTNVVHTPALRMSRFYLNAYRVRSRIGRNRAAKAVVSGLVVACKACGNDVPRLSFWFSNSIVLRATVRQNATKMFKESSENGIDEKFHDENLNIKDESHLARETDAWDDIESFISVLQKIESWLFSRIVDSIWWQTITPYMQSSVANNTATTCGVNLRKTGGGNAIACILERSSFSINHWKRAFTETCERLCPSRAGGHSCGCLQLSSRLVMELLVRRLDVAMFNAILRDSDEEMPTDPVFDPICDSKVLPVLVGKANFGSGVQLKNAVGTWSLWLTAIFGIDDGDSVENNRIYVDGGQKHEVFKAFHLLNALSDLMMFPFKLLIEESTRKEVFPLFGVSLIKKIFSNFVPDEYCSDPISESMLNSLDSQENEEESSLELIKSCPWIMPSIPYLPPTLGTLDHIPGFQSPWYNGEEGDLNDLEHPLDSACTEGKFIWASTSEKEEHMLKDCPHNSRFRLLREEWRCGC